MAPKINDTGTVQRRSTIADKRIGQKVRTLRLAKRLSQTELANMIGVTFQQVQKYEKGVNRIGAGRLQRIANALEVEAPTFFEFKGHPEPETFVMLQSSRAVRLLKAFHKIGDNSTKDAMVRLAESWSTS